MVILLFLVGTIIFCQGMQTSIQFCDGITSKMQQTIESMCKKIPGNKFQNSTYKIYSQFGYDLKAKAQTLLTYQEYKDIQNMLNIFYAKIFPDLMHGYKINSAGQNTELAKKKVKSFIIQQLARQTSLCFPSETSDESDADYIKNLLERNPHLLEKGHSIALEYEAKQFSLFSTNESRDLKLTLFAFAYVDTIIGQIESTLKIALHSKAESALTPLNAHHLEQIIHKYLPTKTTYESV